ncbi:MAG: hypothetical protein ACHQU0_03435 [Candidatus Paceibacteria bacterium]
MFKPFLVAMAIVVGVAGLAFGGRMLDFQINSYFLPREEGLRRDTMIESRAYSEGMTRELYKIKVQYAQTKSDDERVALRGQALHEAAAFDRTRLPPDIQVFLNQLETAR